MWLALVIACSGSDDPVVSGVPRALPVTAEQIASKRENEELRTSPRNLEVNYVKPERVYVDVHFLGGRRWENVREIVIDQLGALVEEAVDAQGREVKRLERGTLTLDADGNIDIVDIPLPEAMRRADAMVACGFSGLADKYHALDREFRVTQFQTFRRIVLHRVAPDDDMVDRLTGYKRQDRIREI